MRSDAPTADWVKRRLQLAAVHEAGHVIVSSHFGYRVKSAWLYQHPVNANQLRVGGKTDCDLRLLDDEALSREVARTHAIIFMAGIASESVTDPSTIGKPHPWSGHPDSERRDSDQLSDDPSDFDMASRYFAHAKSPIPKHKEEGEIVRAYRGAHAVLSTKRTLILTIADAIGSAYNEGERSLEGQRIRELLGTASPLL